MSGQPLPPARLFVLLAREAPVGLILRRGPSDWVQLIHWDTKNDVFTPGQWFHGRIFESKSDLSPDGKLLVYYAFKPQNVEKNPDYSNSWTAISKPPYFTALALWKHWNGYGGGGYFYKNNQMLLNHLDDNRTPHPNHEPPSKLEIVEVDDYTHMSEGVFEQTLIRNGWQVIEADGKPKDYDPLRKRILGQLKTEASKIYFYWANPPVFLMKKNKSLAITCEIIRDPFRLDHIGMYRTSFYHQVLPHYRYRIKDLSFSKNYHLPGITWADVDQQGRLIIARNGKLFSADVQDGLTLSELADFNAHQPETFPAPEWATKW